MASNETFNLVVRAKDEASGVFGMISGRMLGMVSAAAGLAAIGAFLKSSTSAAIESEKAWNNLGNAVSKHGGIWSLTRDKFQSFATALQNQTGISDEAIAESMQKFIDFGASGAQAMDRVRSAADLAAGTNIDFGSATMLLAKASAGATEMLGRYGLKIDESIPKSERFAEAQRLIAERMGGRAIENAKTLAGRIEILSNKYDDLKESIGGVLVGPLTDLVGNLDDQITVLRSNVSWWDKMFSGAEKYAEMANTIRLKELGMMPAHGVFGMPPAGKPPIDPDEVNRAAEALKKLNEQIQANNAFNFEATMEGGPGAFTVVNKAWRDQAAFIDAAKEAHTTGEMNQMSTVFDFARTAWGEQSAASDKLKTESARNFQEFADMIHGSMTNAANDLVGIMFGVRKSFADIFKGMAQDWLSFFISKMLQATAAKAATSLLNFIPGIGPLLAITPAGKVAAGSGGLDIGSAGAGRFASSGTARRANVQVVIQGDVIGEQEYVTRKIIPAIENAIAYGQSKLAVR